MHRFKTKEEFEKEFGPGWRDIVRYNFTPNMDKYLGVYLSKEQVISVYKQDYINNICIIGYHNISEEMIKEEFFIQINSYTKLRELTKLL